MARVQSMATVVPKKIQVGDSLAKDFQQFANATAGVTTRALEASEDTAKRMAQANLSALGKDLMAFDKTLPADADFDEAQQKVDSIYQNYKNVNIGTSQQVYDDMFDNSALPTVGRMKVSYNKAGVKSDTAKLRDAKREELMFTGGDITKDYFDTWTGDVTATGLISRDDAHKDFSDIQIMKFNNKRVEYATINMTPENIRKGYNMSFGAQSKIVVDDVTGINKFVPVGDTPANVVDAQRKAYEKFLGDVKAKREAEVKTSLKKPEVSLKSGSTNANALYENQKAYLENIKYQRSQGTVSVTDKQINDQEIYIEQLNHKVQIVNTIEGRANSFLDGSMTYEAATQAETFTYQLSNGQYFQEDVAQSDVQFYMNQTVKNNEDILRNPETTAEERSDIVAGLVRIEGDSQGRVKSQFLVTNASQTVHGSNTEVKTLSDMSGRLSMALEYRTLTGVDESDSWINGESINALDVEIGQLNARTDIDEAQKVSLIKHSIENKKSEYRDRKLVSAGFSEYLKGVGNDIYSWKLGEQRFASGTLGILHRRLNASQLGTTDFDGFIKEQTMLLEYTPKSTWIPFVGAEEEGVVILKPQGSPESDKVVMEKILYDAESATTGEITDDNIHNHRWGFSNTIRDGSSALTVTIFDNQGTPVYERTYTGTELADGMSPEEVRAEKLKNEAALDETIKTIRER